MSGFSKQNVDAVPVADAGCGPAEMVSVAREGPSGESRAGCRCGDPGQVLRSLEQLGHEARVDLLMAAALRTGGDFRPAFSCSHRPKPRAMLDVFGIFVTAWEEREAIAKWMTIARASQHRIHMTRQAHATLKSPAANDAALRIACHVIHAHPRSREWAEGAAHILALLERRSDVPPDAQ